MNSTTHNYKYRRLLLSINLHPIDRANETGIRLDEATDYLDTLCTLKEWDYKNDYIYLSTSAGGERWAQEKVNKRRVQDLRRGFFKRMQYIEPDLILVSGKFTALELCRACKDLMWKRSTVSQLYRCNFNDLKPRAMVTPSWTAPTMLVPNFGYYGCDTIRRSRLPEGYWARMDMEVRRQMDLIEETERLRADWRL